MRYALARWNVTCLVQREMALTTVCCALPVLLSALVISCLFATSHPLFAISLSAGLLSSGQYAMSAKTLRDKLLGFSA